MLVADSTTIIVFARIERLEILRDSVGEIIVPRAVWEELTQNPAQTKWSTRIGLEFAL